MTDVQLIFDALPPLIKNENCDALYQVIHSKNEISGMKSSCKTLEENTRFLSKWLSLESKHSVDWSRIVWFLIEIPCLQNVNFAFFYNPFLSARQWSLRHSSSILILLKYFQKLLFPQKAVQRTSAEVLNDVQFICSEPGSEGMYFSPIAYGGNM